MSCLRCSFRFFSCTVAGLSRLLPPEEAVSSSPLFGVVFSVLSAKGEMSSKVGAEAPWLITH